MYCEGIGATRVRLHLCMMVRLRLGCDRGWSKTDEGGQSEAASHWCQNVMGATLTGACSDRELL